ncbi:MAG: diaminopimelate epimerase [Acidobacteria bacterium]|nr:diaminopimelate epimerase [Acidobacteriota bacterium]
MIVIPFTKAQGAGNDFLIIESGPDVRLPSADVRRRMCDRHYGVGADGILFLSRSTEHREADADLRIFNSDGGEVEISGNGTRCAAAYLVNSGQFGSELVIRTGAGCKRLQVVSRRENRFEFEMAMGAPVFSPEKIPFRPPDAVPEPVIGYILPIGSRSRKVTVTSMGNPHCSILVDDFEWDWETLGEQIERHPYFPNRTNVEFYRAVSRDGIEVRFWERGVGFTLSSGTGSCAAAVAAILNKLVESPTTVRTLSDTLGVHWDGGEVILKGPAEIVCRGEYFSSVTSDE